MNLKHQMTSNSYRVMSVVIHLIFMKHFESKIKDSVQTTDNPFDNESTFISTESRATQRRKNQSKGIMRSRSKRIRQNEKIDKEIASEKGIVNILYDSSN